MSSPVLIAAQDATRALRGVWYGHYGMARCPAHEDAKPSLSITAGESAVLYHCFAGCTQDALIAALRARRIGRALPATRSASLANPGGAPDRQRLALAIWDKAKSVRDTPAGAYLERRGLHANGQVRFDPAARTIEEVDGQSQTLILPALVIPIRTDAELVAVQRVFLTPEGEKAAIPSPKKILGTVGGGAIRLGLPPREVLNLAEGYEDAQSAIQLHGLTHCWAVAGIARYRSVFVPEGCKTVRIYSQHGGEAATAIEAGRPHLTAEGRALEVLLPPKGGDWNDVLVKAGSAAEI